MPISPQINQEQTALYSQVCTKTVMDMTDPDITFDSDGISNYWHEYQEFKKDLPDENQRESMLLDTVKKIKESGEGKPYDCVLGLSGGVDSSYLAWLADDLGLRPLVVHFDNGWNSELAVSNIEQLVSAFGYDLETFVMDWDEFRDLQRCYFKASVIDLEVPTDHMIFGALHRVASKKKIKYILSGTNHTSEWLLPKAWYHKKQDLVNIKGINRAFGKKKLKKLPALGVWQAAYYHYIRNIRTVPLLDLIDYNKATAKDFLIKKLGWRDYGGKHHESIFTRFYQGYILPKKFNVDKRKAHLSTLILSGQLSRDEAILELEKPTYDEDLKQSDNEYVAKKLGFSREEFANLLDQPNIAHNTYGTDETQRHFYFKVLAAFKPIVNLFRS